MIGEPVLVMLIEDNADHAELIIRTLEEHRIANRVRHFLDGQTALDYLFQRGEFSDPAKSPRPHVILLDLRLPRVDGIDILKTIKNDDDLKCIPVVVLTTSEAEKDVTKAYYNHANSYLVNPVGFEEFKELTTNRVREMGHRPLLVVKEKSGGTPSVAVDAVGCIPGDWVICVGSSAAREAAGSKDFPSDLTIVGIIDHWQER